VRDNKEAWGLFIGSLRRFGQRKSAVGLADEGGAWGQPESRSSGDGTTRAGRRDSSGGGE
jgi:hypothetical protein